MQPTPYTPVVNFSNEELTNVGGRTTVRAAALDAELTAVQTTLTGVLASIALNQRDDGNIRDQRVKLFTLASDVLAVLSAGTGLPRGAWLTATAYALRDIVTQGGNTYTCCVAHTSGTFATDLSAVKWLLLALGSGLGASAVVFAPTGTLSATDVQAAINEADTENRALLAAYAASLASSASAGSGAGLLATNLALNYSAGTVGNDLQQRIPVVANYATLRARSKTLLPAVVLVLAPAGTNIAGGGHFWYDSTDTTTAENYGTVIVGADGGRWKRLFTGDLWATWFDAKVDGSTDDAIAVTRALTVATNPVQQKVRVPKGSIVFGSTITVPAGASLLFDSKDSSTVIYTGGITTSGSEYSLFKLNNYSTVSGFTARYPNENTTGTPKAYPPTITHAGSGCSYAVVQSVCFSGAYIGIQFGDSTTGLIGCGNINIDDCDGFPFYRGVVIDGCVDICNITRTTFNSNKFGARYAASISGWVAQNGVGFEIFGADAVKIDRCLTYTYKSYVRTAVNALGKSCQFLAAIEPTGELCGVPIDAVNFTNQFDVTGGTFTGQCGEGSINGVVGVSSGMALGSGDNTYYCKIKFRGTTFRSFPGSIATVKTNVEFANCEAYQYNKSNAVKLGAIAMGANNMEVKWNGGGFDGSSQANNRGIDNQGAYTGCVITVGGGCRFTNWAADYTVFQPSKTLIVCGVVGAGSMFYNGLAVTFNSQGLMMTGAIPAAGTWAVDDRFVRSSAAAGSPKAWTCTAAGTPGTWTSEGNL